MSFNKFAIGAAILTGALTVQPVAATTFVTGTVRSNAAFTFGGASPSDPKMATISAPGTVGVSSAVSNGQKIAVSSSMTATWNSADSGSVDMLWGWSVNTVAGEPTTLITTNPGAPSWSYSFIASGDGLFTMAYKITPTGSPTGMISIIGSGGLGHVPFSGTSISQGTLFVPLVAGQSYTFGLRNQSNLGDFGAAKITSNAVGEYDWAITYNVVNPLPEPASWAMMIAGIGLVGASMRRRAPQLSFA